MNKAERKIFQVFITLLAVICFLAGGVSAFGGMNGSASFAGMLPIFDPISPLRGFADNEYRFAFGVFFTQGIVLLYFLRNIELNTTLFRFVALGLFIGGLARVSNILEYGVVDSQVVGPTVIELVVVPLLVLWHARVLKLRNPA